MASSVPPIKGSAYTTYISLISQADSDIFQKSVSLVAGDVKVSKDGAGENNIATLPVEIGTSGVLAVALNGTEMTADTVTVRFCDAAGDEWCDALLVLHTAAQSLDTVDTNVDSILADTGTDGVVLAANAITAAKIATDAITSDELAATATAEIAAAAWAYGTRTLTQSASSVATAIEGSVITIHRGDSFSVSFTALGDISGRSKLWFTVKENPADADAASVIQIEETAGLVYLNATDASTRAANGVITVTDAVAGDLTITLDEVETDDLSPETRLFYDVQMLTAAGAVSTLTANLARVTADITRAVA